VITNYDELGVTTCSYTLQSTVYNTAYSLHRTTTGCLLLLLHYSLVIKLVLNARNYNCSIYTLMFSYKLTDFASLPRSLCCPQLIASEWSPEACPGSRCRKYSKGTHSIFLSDSFRLPNKDIYVSSSCLCLFSSKSRIQFSNPITGRMICVYFPITVDMTCT